jgi:transposase-like protein
MIAAPGEFHTGRMIRYQRYEPQVVEGLTQMFVAGVISQKVREATQALSGISPSSNSVSRLNQTFLPAQKMPIMYWSFHLIVFVSGEIYARSNS